MKGEHIIITICLEKSLKRTVSLQIVLNYSKQYGSTLWHVESQSLQSAGKTRGATEHVTSQRLTWTEREKMRSGPRAAEESQAVTVSAEILTLLKKSR